MAEVQNKNKRLGYDQVRDKILASEMDVNIQYPGISDFDPPILEVAINKQDTELIDYLLQHNVDVNRIVEFRKQAIHLAVESDDIELAQKLLNAGAICLQVKGRYDEDFNAYSLVKLAHRRKNKEMVNLLLERLVVYVNKYDRRSGFWSESDYPKLLGDMDLRASMLSAIKQNKIELLKKLMYHYRSSSKNLLVKTTGHISYEIAEFLIDNGAYSIQDLRRALNRAIECENIPTVKLLIRKGADANLSDRGVKGPLEIAFDKKNVEMIEILIAAGFDATKTFDIDNSLHIAIIQNNYEKIKNFIENRVDINDTSYFKKTPLTLAVEENNKLVIELLLKNGAKPEQATILAAIKNNNLDVVKILIDSGAYISLTTLLKVMEKVIYENEPERYIFRGLTEDSGPLRLSTSRKYEEFIKLLIKNGVDVNYQYSFKGSPLDIACKHNDLELVKILVEAGANVHISLNEYYPIKSAVEHNNYQLAEYLVNHCTAANIPCDYSEALICAVEWDRKEIVELLIKNGANINYMPLYTSSALIHSIKNCTPEITEMLVKAGANVNMNLRNNTALIEAIKVPDYKMIPYLIENGADVDVSINKIGSLLNWYFRSSKSAVISLALDVGADVNVVDENDKTAIDFFSNTENFQTLIEHTIKLKAANLYLIDKNLDAVEGNQFNDFYSKCLDEVEFMKTQWYFGKSSFYDILHSCVNKISRNVKFISKDDIIFDKNALCSKFKLYGGIIYYRVLKAKHRKEYLVRADKIISHLFGNLLPYTLRQDVLSCLNNEDLYKILINQN
ncbi:putative ankyrin repeat protein RF_0381 [Microplitis mediator]|uniref:putative ankyrin repeat protein RF_0381 n=1 Tax=Microplitis mediator TaxID=375433 RepID=UPI0025541784|nr:putative ankyrin repeat protein RF_0381 [Microplitis mediator]XP_057334147.1 putative ankyrin repeat protein RF_0381 [Microplitis mediator]